MNATSEPELTAAGGGEFGGSTFNFSGDELNRCPPTSAASDGMAKSPACRGVSVKLYVTVDLVSPLTKLNWLDGPM